MTRDRDEMERLRELESEFRVENEAGVSSDQAEAWRQVLRGEISHQEYMDYWRGRL